MDDAQPSSSKRRFEDADDKDPREDAAHHPETRPARERQHGQHDHRRLSAHCHHPEILQQREVLPLPTPAARPHRGPFRNVRNQKLSMCTVSETGERAQEVVVSLDPNMTASFNFLHDTGTAKATSFNLPFDISL
ncbi:hypothetical protein DFH11DRAFT_887610 [Phellopilus nigrolimitatus]|nr:hypothetical protein DFH11DRAFT_887610 [Phellopilus nigrolimitatus]